MDLHSWILSIVWLDEFPNLILFFLKTDSWIAKPLNSELFDTDSRPEIYGLNSIIIGGNFWRSWFSTKFKQENKKLVVFWNLYP